METNVVGTVDTRLLTEALALRAAFPDTGAMTGLSVSDLPAGSPGDGGEGVALHAALRFLRDEMLVVRAGKAVNLIVLDDEIANVERLLRHT